MFKTYLKTTFRNLWKNKVFSFLNITGLAIGIACSAFIFLWVEDELTFNHNFTKRDQLYRVMENITGKDKIATSGNTPGPLAQAMKAEIPGVKNAARLSWNVDQVVVLGDKSVKEQGIYADPSIFSMLTFHFIHGNTATAFKEPQSVVISETLAAKLFGNSDPVGKIIKMNAQESYSADGSFMVTGVFKNLPANATYSSCQWISPYIVFEDKNPWLKPWSNNLTATLVELDPAADPAAVNKKLAGYLRAKTADAAAPDCFLFSMNDWNLRDHFTDGKQDGGNIKYVKLFSLIAGIILLIACINFMNLSTARSEQRAREVGVRKVMGAGKGRLISQFIGESMSLSFLSVLLAIAIVYVLLPAYNLLVGKDLSLHLFSFSHLVYLLGIGLTAGLVAGSYPAFYLSSFNPVTVLKSMKIRTGGGVIFIRKGLVITQFAVSITLIICTAIIYLQIQHIKHRDLGFSKNNLVNIPLQSGLKEHFTAVKDQLLATGAVENAALSLHDPLHLYSSTDRFTWAGKDLNDKIFIHSNAVNPEYLSTMHMQLISGRDFYSDGRSVNKEIIINESLAKIMGKEGQPGGMLQVDTTHLQVAGVIKDFVYNDMYGSGTPALFFCIPNAATLMTIRFKPGVSQTKALEKVAAVIQANNPGFPFEFRFVDDDFNKLFITETLIGKLAGLFAALAIFISCLGLFGLAAYTVERRTKEIGIRKILGASANGLAGLLSRDFMQLVAIACAIAFPLAWWAMHSWLQHYEYRTVIPWWIFMLAGAAALMITLLTVSLQAFKAAMANPLKSLKTE